MTQTTNIIERAFQLARSGSCVNPLEIAKTLQRENFTSVEAHLGAPSLRKELAALCRAARAAETPPTPAADTPAAADTPSAD